MKIKRLNCLKQIKEVLGKLLDHDADSAALEKSFLELGINSVLAVELVETLNNKLGIDLGIEAVFDYRGANELAEYIADNFNGKAARMPANKTKKPNGGKGKTINQTSKFSRSDLEGIMKKVLAEILENNVKQNALNRSFLELGINSVLAVELVEALNEKLGINMGVEVVFDYKDAIELAGHVKEEFFTGGSFQQQNSIAENQAKIDNSKIAVLSIPEIEATIKEVMAGLLKLRADSSSMDKSFLDLGLTSELVEGVNEKLGIDLELKAVFDYRGVRELAEFIFSQYGTGSGEELQESTTYASESERPTVVAGQAYQSKNVTAVDLTAKHKTEIAIIGISGKFAGSQTIEEFWKHLQSGDECIQEINRKGWQESEFYDTDPSGKNKSISKWAGLLDDIERFDPLFFNISPLEAMRMDPQQRLFIEEAFKAFEDGGYSTEELSGKKVGVFVGGRVSDYKDKTLLEEEISSQTFLGNDMAILSSRLSYFLNLKGPSIALDTACSSSLVAIHTACESIRNGESDMALAGGVFVMSSPEFYVMASKTAMLSPDGKCKTFDDSADGIVIGEGVGAVVLKRLDTAVEDGDHIYGVIKGSAINQDGRTKGITAPSMLSQKALLYEAYKKASVNPETVSYIEAHGTGTKLGDPIEVKALTEAFRMYTDKVGFCAIGSHKPNFGHTIISAGIAGVFKILMAMKYRQIPPTISVKEVNRHIDFENSPFYVNTKLREWKSENNVPLRAGVSSFGFSGTNSHIIIEEPPARKSNTDSPPYPFYIFPFSAKSKESLRRKLEDTAEWLEREMGNFSAGDISYTLFNGRSHFEYRCAFIAKDLEQLKNKILMVNKNGTAEDYYFISDAREEGVNDIQEEAGQRLLEEINQYRAGNPDIYKQKLETVVSLYVTGYKLNWGVLYSKGSNNRVPMPAYPFSGENYWIPSQWKQDCYDRTQAYTYLHPLLHFNTSSFTEQRFSSTFTGQEFFLKDHVVRGKKVLPGVATLEMARAAVEAAVAPENGKDSRITLRNVVWARPITVTDSPVKVNIRLYTEDNGGILYQIYSNNEEENSADIIYSQGSITISRKSDQPELDLEALKTSLSKVAITHEQLYMAYGSMGIDYGPGHKGVQEIRTGEGKVLAKISLSGFATDIQEQFVLHPGMLDSALQASLGLRIKSMEELPELALPFALKEIEITGSCSSEMWALVSYTEGSKAGDEIEKLDVDLIDDNGKICARLKALSTKVLNSKFNKESISANYGTVLLKPYWKEQDEDVESKAPKYIRHIVMFIEPDEDFASVTKPDIVDCIVLKSVSGDIGERFLEYAQQIFDEIRNIIIAKTEGLVLLQILFSGKAEGTVFRGLSGLLKSAVEESSKIAAQLIEIESWNEHEKVIEILKNSSMHSQDIHIRYSEGKRLVVGWSDIDRNDENGATVWRDKGVYLITGGAGELGLIFAREISDKVKSAILIFTGRSELDDGKKEKIDKIKTAGTQIIYIQADMTDMVVVRELIKSITEDFGHLNGIIHAAGIIRDSLTYRKTAAEFSAVLSPKVLGAVNADLASKDLELDFFILFSSVAGALGNPGQTDYAAANAFLNAFAEYRNTLAESGQRSGRTISINWPLWKEGGMHINAQSEDMLRQRIGMIPMETETGVKTFYKCVAAQSSQVLALEGYPDEIREKLYTISRNIAKRYHDKNPELCGKQEADQEGLIEKIDGAIKQHVSKKLKIKLDYIKSNAELSKYGFDSITLVELTNQLNRDFMLTLTPTIFFEYTTIGKLAEYLANEYENELVSRFELQPQHNTSSIAAEVVIDQIQSTAQKPARWLRPLAVSEKRYWNNTAHEPVAIIGLSGVFPKSENVNALWRNLSEGKNCITEIPENRWNWQEYYGDPMKEHNKTRIKWGGFIDGADQFDPLFFGISPKEAELMDPQQRLLLMQVWKAIEDAGIIPGHLAQQPTGVFVSAVGLNEYLNLNSIPKDNAVAMTSIVPSMVPNRISYVLNLKGPSEYFETACSSVFVALHRAVQSLQLGECGYAIVGGVNLLLSPMGFAAFEAMGFLSPEGQTRAFQTEANGYTRSEGAGAMLLKPLKKAVEDKDNIYAVIKGTGVAHGGKGMSMTAPSAAGIKAAMLQAYNASAVEPQTVSYIEAHGIGSPLGDSIEINALKAGYQELSQNHNKYIDRDFACYIGNINGCIGHGEVVSGMAAITKVIFAMKNRLMPGIPDFTALHENISLKGSPYRILSENREWESLKDENGEKLPRRAGISSYGFGGVNAHVVLEEYIKETYKASEAVPQIMIFSAFNRERLRDRVKQMLDFAVAYEDLNLEEIAYTLQVGRMAMNARVVIVVNNREEFLQGMKEFLNSFEKDIDIETSIPVYSADLNEEHSELRSLLSGKLEDALLGVLLEDRNLEKIALYWVNGGNIPWKLLHKDNIRRISLPTYPFEKKSYWISRTAEKQQIEKVKKEQNTGSHNVDNGADSLHERVRVRISELTGIPVGELPAGKPLVALGFSSMQAVTLKYLLEQDLCLQIPISAVSEQGTLEELVRRLKKILAAADIAIPNAGARGNAPETSAQEIIPDLNSRYESFPLSDIQESFLTGRKLRFGGDWVGCHIYFEIQTDKLDIYRLNKAWQKLTERHDMLRAVIMQEGRQKILEKTPAYRFKTNDLRWKNTTEIQEHFINIRNKMSHKVYRSDEWPLFEIRVSVLPDNSYIIHFSIDELIIDASGIYQLLSEWKMFYEDMAIQLPELKVSFRDYLLRLKQMENTVSFNKDLEYWLGKLKNMPDGPRLTADTDAVRADNNDSYYRVRLEGVLEEVQWRKLKKKAEDLKVSPTPLLLSIFAAFLGIWNGQKSFSLILTFFNRLPLHPQINQMIGPFISTNIFVVKDIDKGSFEDFAVRNQELLWEDLDHSSVSGIRALRELKAKHKISKAVFLPVVFTSMINSFKNNDSDNNNEFFKQISFMVTQTPQVYLDHQVYEQDNMLKFSWDAAEGILGEKELKEMFSAYCKFLNIISSSEDIWDLNAMTKEIKDFRTSRRKAFQALSGVRENFPAEVPELITLPGDRYEPFPLTDMQQAYISGRNGQGATNCHYYLEIESEQIDIRRLEIVWNKLIEVHEMLTAVIRQDGSQIFLEEVPQYKITVFDLSGRTNEKIKRELGRTKRRMLESVFELDRWPLFELSASIIDSNMVRLHLNIDMLIADGNSIQLLIGQLFYFYEHPEEQPVKPLLSYRDYIFSLQEYRNTEGYQLGRKYWDEKFAAIPPGPGLPLKEDKIVPVSYEHEQYSALLENWEVLKDKAHKLSVSYDAILLTAYMEVFAAWTDHKPFTIAVPCWERLLLDKSINELVGDFTAMSWISDDGKKRSFSEKVILNNKTLKEDLSHKAVSGLKALRKTSMRKAKNGGLAFPVVFSSLAVQLFEGGSGFKKLEPVTRTPQVYIDTISEQRDGQLHIFWNTAKGVYADGLTEKLFSGYERLLRALADKPDNWDELDLQSLIRPESKIYIQQSGKVIEEVV